MGADETFRRDLGIDSGGIIILGDKEFFEEEFWVAMESATNGQVAALQTADRAFSATIAPPNDAWIFHGFRAPSRFHCPIRWLEFFPATIKFAKTASSL